MSRPPLIAIVDDDAAMRDALAEFLHVAGLEGRTYGCAAEFLHDYFPGRFSLVITDFNMPEMNGIELIRHLRTLGDAPPVILATSSKRAEMGAGAIQSGAVAYFTKPFDNDALLDLVTSLLARGGRRPLTE